jgi:ABC-2 type transport system permease protein
VFKPLVRVLAFFGKEINEVRRQPRLVFSLILGPFLILLLFGIGYRGTPPPLRIALVIPEDEMDNPRLDSIKKIIEDNFDLVETTSDEAHADQLLDRDQVDVVEIFPSDVEEKLNNGEQIWVGFRYREINPVDEQWLKYTGYVQVNALNQQMLMETAGGLQDEAAETNAMLAVTRAQLDALDGDSSPEEREEARQSISELQILVALLAADPVRAQAVLGPDADQEELQRLSEDLAALDQTLAEGDIEEDDQERIQETRDRVSNLEEITGRLSTVPSNVLVQPLQFSYQNIYGTDKDGDSTVDATGQPCNEVDNCGALPLMIFYAPGVLALILQHIAVTLGALSLVRERLLGAIEMFGVAPTSMVQVLIGKIFAYLVFIGVIALALVGLLVFGLKVPFAGSIPQFVITMVLFVLASICVGLLISALSNSDTQAVQLSMIVLLVSIFFSGFFLPLEQFHAFAQWIGYALPVTHGMNSFIDLLLLGRFPGMFSWMALALITAVTLLLTMMIWGRQFRRLQ